MKLFHGSYNSTAPEIKVGAFAMSGDNVFDGLFTSSDIEIAGSHGDFVHSYEVDNIAESSDLNDRIDEVVTFLADELGIDAEEAAEIAEAIAEDECDDSFSHLVSPRSCTENASWEMQRLRGRVAAHLGFDAVEMNDEHGTSYLIVNQKITAV
ncbi:hypothetical protein P88_00670 [Erwinia phage phiEt88]|uniref:hypothetical protein n=1 Tax=Erwinia phage phiEt88 TaxID=925984 RepID=UPI0001F1FC93|nr:hypothetical protein ErPhphiEt88_gp67 [Erwinia phage phiEt88]CBX44578.1 hypothetical protein P88_00670 [Erwinia phage phiEt88]